MKTYFDIDKYNLMKPVYDREENRAHWVVDNENLAVLIKDLNNLPPEVDFIHLDYRYSGEHGPQISASTAKKIMSALPSHVSVHFSDGIGGFFNRFTDEERKEIRANIPAAVNIRREHHFDYRYYNKFVEGDPKYFNLLKQHFSRLDKEVTVLVLYASLPATLMKKIFAETPSSISTIVVTGGGKESGEGKMSSGYSDKELVDILSSLPETVTTVEMPDMDIYYRNHKDGKAILQAKAKILAEINLKNLYNRKRKDTREEPTEESETDKSCELTWQKRDAQVRDALERLLVAARQMRLDEVKAIEENETDKSRESKLQRFDDIIQEAREARQQFEKAIRSDTDLILRESPPGRVDNLNNQLSRAKQEFLFSEKDIDTFINTCNTIIFDARPRTYASFLTYTTSPQNPLLQQIDFDKHLEAIFVKFINLDKRANPEAAKTALKLYDDLFKARKVFLSPEGDVKKFSSACQRAINQARPVLEQQRGWGKVLASLVNAILKLVNATGLIHFGLYAPKKTASGVLLDNVESAIKKPKP